MAHSTRRCIFQHGGAEEGHCGPRPADRGARKPGRRPTSHGGVTRGAVVGLAVLLAFLPSHLAEAKTVIAAFGTSLTARGGWQDALAHLLTERTGRPVEVVTVARSGATSDWAVANVGSIVALRPATVLIEFHANDAALDEMILPGRSAANMDRVLERLRRDLPEARLVVMAMNPMHGLRGAIRPFMARYIEAHREAAARAGAEFLDLRPAWAKLPDAELAKAIPDGAHPRPDVAAAVIAPAIAAFLAPR